MSRNGGFIVIGSVILPVRPNRRFSISALGTWSDCAMSAFVIRSFQSAVSTFYQTTEIYLEIPKGSAVR
jgi:hypothetical protein